MASRWNPFNQNGVWMLSKGIRRLGMVAGIIGVPVAAWGMYERSNPLPPPLDNGNYPLSARFYIRRALWQKDLGEKAFNLDWAMQKVLAAGLGPASPEATNLVIYLSQLYLNEIPPKLKHLTASYAALSHKPHVGEGVREERARLEMSFRVAVRLCELLAKDNPEGARDFATNVINAMDRAPPFLAKTWGDHPLRPIFNRYLATDSVAVESK